MSKNDAYTISYTPGASGVWWSIRRNGADTGRQGCSPTRRVAERDASEALARLHARAA